MFQFPALASCQAGWHSFRMSGCPIRKSSDQRLFAPTRSLSQLITSFIASVSLGIRHTPFLTFFTTVFAISLTWQRISSSYFQLYSNKVKSHLAIWFTLVWTKVHYLQFCLCQYVKDLFKWRVKNEEWRIHLSYSTLEWRLWSWTILLEPSLYI